LNCTTRFGSISGPAGEEIMMKLVFGLALVLSAVFLATAPTSAQPAATQDVFCDRWGGVFGRVCRPGVEPRFSCQEQRQFLTRECKRTGCFNFRSGARCFSNAADRELTDPKYRPKR
jgi:hypothetical protein